jgi:hypothetical protein
MRYADSPLQRTLLERPGQFRHLAQGANAIQLRSLIENRNAGRVITAVLKPPQPFQQYRRHLTPGNGAYNSTHSSINPVFIYQRNIAAINGAF